MNIIKNLKTFTTDTRKNELIDYLNLLSYKSNLPEKKFVIFAHCRTGSTLLTRLLNCHPDIFCDYEIFEKFIHLGFKTVFFPYLYAKSQSIKTQKKVYGFDLKLYQIKICCIHKLNYNEEKLVTYLHKDNWKFIYLHRENLLNKVFSRIKANTRQQYDDTPTNPLERKPVYIEINKLIKAIKWDESRALQEKEIMSKIPHLKIIYENNLLHSNEHQNTANMIFNYLGLECVSVTSSMKKVSLNSVWDDIENAQEVIDFIKQTEYSMYL